MVNAMPTFLVLINGYFLDY